MRANAKAICFLISMIFTSCAHYSTTQQNIKKVNAVFEAKKTEAKTTSSTQQSDKKNNNNSEAIPLAQFLDAHTPGVVQSVNPWFSKLQEWARIYVDIAKSERDVRNYILSSKYSSIGAVWASRAKQIKDLPTAEAATRVNQWIDKIQWPVLPETSSYFTAQEVYAKIFITRNTLLDLTNKFCLVSKGTPIVGSLAYLDLAIDLYKQKKYSKALYKIQNASSSLENMKPGEDKKCSLNEADEEAK